MQNVIKKSTRNVISYILSYNFSTQYAIPFLKARLHRRFLSRNTMQFLSRSELQLQNCTWKPGAIFSAICRGDIAGVSNMFGT